ncbi:MAG: hypothetical protein KC635_25240 [Myxococcales bacterium]|nr:hypothetical protein [Myxococcales bacterium]
MSPRLTRPRAHLAVALALLAAVAAGCGDAGRPPGDGAADALSADVVATDPLVATPARVELDGLAAATATLENRGDADLVIDAITVTGGPFDFVRQGLPDRLAPGESGEIVLRARDCTLGGFVVVRYDGDRALQIPIVPKRDFDDHVQIDLFTPIAGGVERPVDGDATLLARRAVHLHPHTSCVLANDALRWQITPPAGGSARLVPVASLRGVMSLTPDTGGTWRVTLELTTATGAVALGERTLEVVDPVDLEVELTWRTPADPDETDHGCSVGTDLDVHLARERDDGTVGWQDQELDAFFTNPVARGTPELPDDGTAYLATGDDEDGLGPELIHLTTPGPERYHLGATFFADSGFPLALATLRVRLRGAVVSECGPTPMVVGDLWELATYDGASGALTAGCGVVHRGFFEGYSGYHGCLSPGP